MTMQKDDLEQVIREDLYKEGEAIQKAMDASGTEDIPDALKKDIRFKLQERIEAYEEERVYAGLSEKDREALRLGRKLQEERSAAKHVRRKRRWKMYAASAAAVVLVLTAGITSMGGAEKIVSVIEQVIGERRVVKVNSDEESKVSENEDEKKAYQEIKDTFGVLPVKLANLKKGTKFIQMNLDDNLQVAELRYEYDNKTLLYIVSAGFYDSSFGFDADDEVIEKEILDVGGNRIELTVYQIKKTGTIKCSAHFTHQKLEYFMTGKIAKEEFEKILKNLYFS